MRDFLLCIKLAARALIPSPSSPQLLIPPPPHPLATGKYNEGMFMFVRVMVNSLPALYLLSFFAATRYAGVSADTEPPLVFVVVGGILGGIGVGLMWVAQGAYMTRIAITYAEEQRIDVVTATTRLAGCPRRRPTLPRRRASR